MESPVLRSNTGTLYASMNLSKSYTDVQDNPLIQTFLDKVCFTPQWTEETLSLLHTFNQSNRVLAIGSEVDSVSDIRGMHHLFHSVFKKGEHARLFYDNDFGVIQEYLENFDELKEGKT